MLTQIFGASGEVRLPHGLASADHAMAPTSTVSRTHVVAAERVSVAAMRLVGVRQPTLARGVHQVVALRTKREVRGVDALSVVARMHDDAPLRNRAVLQAPRKTVRGELHGCRQSEPSIAVDVEQPAPFPASFGLYDAAPELRGDLFGSFRQSRGARVNSMRQRSFLVLGRPIYSQNARVSTVKAPRSKVYLATTPEPESTKQ